MKRVYFLLCILPLSVFGQAILPLKDQAKAIESIQEERFNILLPQLMEEHTIDTWVSVSYTHLTLPTKA